MIKKDLLQQMPRKRIQPVDGMAVTAQVWDEAHRYHLQFQRFHELLRHGPGIVSGLEAVASDPVDSSVYILPGIAVDPHGNLILLEEPVAYDVGSAHGLLYLLLSYEESRPTPASDQEDGPLYIHAQFGIEAVPALPDTPCVELARIWRKDRDSSLSNAKDPEQPGLNEIDQRFRREAGNSNLEPIRVAVCYTSGLKDARQGHGAGNVARALRRSGQRVWVDDRVPLSAALETYSLVYLVGSEAFQLNRDEMNGLYGYLQAGGTMLVESCRRHAKNGEPAADASFFDLFASMGVPLEALDSGHDLLVDPYLFAAPPPGFETEGAPKLMAGGGVIFSTYDYGCLWQGLRRDQPASREQIRTAIEWGSNIVTYSLKRRQEIAGK